MPGTGAPAFDVAVEGLSKWFLVPERDAGLAAAMRSLARRKHREVRAVDGVGFAVAPGEVVGFLGPNGAGKTTTLKMLTGLLHPSAGTASVLGHVPWRREKAFLARIALVMGNRNQLQWDLPALDSYEMNRSIYRIDDAAYRHMLDELVELLEIGDLVRKPVRTLSLGERMKAELAGSLLHRPQVLFLDEPTIGLDVTMQKRIRGFVGRYNDRHGATVMLTSHYMADVTALCRRVIVIHGGRILADGDLRSIAEEFRMNQTVTVTLAHPGADLAPYGEVLGVDDGRVTLRVARGVTSATAARLLADHAVTELTIEDPPIEDVIEQVFATLPASGPADPEAR